MLLVAVTGWGQQSDKESTAAAGFDMHLVKPVDPAQILALLTGFARRRGPGPGRGRVAALDEAATSRRAQRVARASLSAPDGQPRADLGPPLRAGSQ